MYLVSEIFAGLNGLIWHSSTLSPTFPHIVENFFSSCALKLNFYFS